MPGQRLSAELWTSRVCGHLWKVCAPHPPRPFSTGALQPPLCHTTSRKVGQRRVRLRTTTKARWPIAWLACSTRVRPPQLLPNLDSWIDPGTLALDVALCESPLGYSAHQLVGPASNPALEDHPDGAGRRWRGRGHGHGQRVTGARASRSPAAALPSAARASLRLPLCHGSRRGVLGAPQHRVGAPSAARAAGARSTRDLRRGADHHARRAAARRRFFTRCAPPAAHAAHATSPLYFSQLSLRQEAGPAHHT